ncbi:MAG: hypothetical protein LBR85_09580 [Oscillospiraceae bacterium]|jgi:hypothetical protein|nr:hypothetical protein [Oscillospiraceae bacterium]
MEQMLARMTSRELQNLMAVILSSETVSDEQMRLLDDIAKEEIRRAEYTGVSEEKVQASFSALMRYIEEDEAAPKRRRLRGRKAAKTPPRPRRVRFSHLTAAAMVFAALFIANAVTLAAGFDFFGTFARWTKDTVYFVFGSPPPSEYPQPFFDRNPEYVWLETALEENGVQIDLPKYLPEGFYQHGVDVDGFTNYTCILAWFVDGENSFSISIDQIPPNGVSGGAEVNPERGYEVYKDKYMVLTNYERVVAIWFQGCYQITLQGDLAFGQLTDILDSI